MKKSDSYSTTEEIKVLNAISRVSARLARNLAYLEAMKDDEEGEHVEDLRQNSRCRSRHIVHRD
jgi:hypothetical protein